MKNAKRIFSLMLCLMLVLSIPLSASADTIDNTEDYITFRKTGARMTSDGGFTFNLSYYVSTVAFTANSTSLWIATSAQVYDTSLKEYHTDSAVTFKVELYKKANNSLVGSYTGMADGIYGGKSFDVTSGAKYYIKVSVTGSLCDTEKLRGYGNVSPVTVSST